MNRGVDSLGVSEIDINPRGRRGDVCARGTGMVQGPLVRCSCAASLEGLQSAS